MSLDLETSPSVACPLVTKRVVVAQVSVCVGCCCGNVARGKPPVPVELLKQEWRKRGLSKSVQLTVSGCLGPCDLLNVVRISGASQDVWLGHFCTDDDYTDLVTWAQLSKDANREMPLTSRMNVGRFDPFRSSDRESRPIA
jgi:cobaltochelatase CobN